MEHIKVNRQLDHKNLEIKSQNVPEDNINVKVVRDYKTQETNLFDRNPDEDFDKTDMNDDLGMQFLANMEKKQEPVEDEEEPDDEDEEPDDYNPSNFSRMFDNKSDRDETSENVMLEKASYLAKIKRLVKSGAKIPRFLSMASSLAEIKGEWARIAAELDVDRSVNFAKDGMLMCLNGLELINGIYNPLNLRLDGWQKSVRDNIGSYDEVLTELCEKYGTSFGKSPEIKLLLMLTFSLFNVHVKNSLMQPKSPIDAINNLMNMKTNEMKGPSTSAEDLLSSLENDLSDEEKEDEVEIKSVDISLKKRGRPRKN